MPKKRKIVGVILAAGKGTRIKPINFEYPKPLLPVCNKPIMVYQIEEMKNLGIEEIFVVIGHLGGKIKRHFGDGKKYGVKISYVRQKERLGIAHAVGQLERYIQDPFLLFLGDIFYIPKNLRKMITVFNRNKAGAVLAVKKEKDPDLIKRNFSLVLGRNKLVKRVIEKPRYVSNNLKGCGIYLFDLPVFDAIRNTPRTAMRDEYEITTTIQLLIDYGYKVFAADVIDWDMNITFTHDLLRCNLEQLARMKMRKIIDPTAKIKEGTKILNSVVGRNVLIKKPIKVTNSVIFPEVKISKSNDISDSIITQKVTVKKPDLGINL